MQEFTLSTCRTIVNGAGSLHRIGELCQQLHMRRPLVVTDAGIEQLGILQQLRDHLHNSGIDATAFTQVVADPPEHVVAQAAAQATHDRADGVIGLGGGSSLDTAKLVALLARSGAALADIYGVDKARGERLPLVLIPTTAGTGSEVTAVAIVTTGATTKQGVVAHQLIADVALLDAELTLGLPPSITAMTGIDAMVHAVEAYTSIHRKNPYTDMLAREALRLLAANIERATRDGADLEARQGMLLGACLAGQAFANAPVAAVHALAYPLGGNYHLPHGLTNSLVLPHVLRFNSEHAATWYAELACILLPAALLAPDTAGRCKQLIDYFARLATTLGLPTTLAAASVPAADLPRLATEALQQTRLLVNNPRPVTYDDALAIYQAAY